MRPTPRLVQGRASALRCVAVTMLTGLVWLAAGAAARDQPTLQVGDPAPDFTLQATDGEIYSLADFRGRQAVVLAWYPRAFTRGCTIECKSLAQNGHLLREYDVRYFMASVDDLETNNRFAEAQQADFPLLSDPTRQTARAYGVLRPDAGVADRQTFYIGPDGTILAIDRAVNPETSAEDMAARLKSLGVPQR